MAETGNKHDPPALQAAPVIQKAAYGSRVPALDETAWGVVRGASAVFACPLLPAAVAELRRFALVKDDRVVGYPCRRALVPQPKTAVGELRAVLLASGSYASGIRQRCADKTLFGIRFVKGDRRVEVAIGDNCRRALWAYANSSGVRLWGEILEPAAYDRLRGALRPASDPR